MQAVTTPELADWTRRIRASDVAAYTALYDALHAGLLRYAWSMTHDEAAAYDLLQETFTRLWEHRATLDPKRSVKAFLFRIIHHLALKHLQQQQRMADWDDTLEQQPALQADSAAPPRLDAERLHDLLQRWIDAMPPRRREVFTLSRSTGLSHQEIATVLDISPRTVNNHLVEALRYLRERLDAFDIDYHQA